MLHRLIVLLLFAVGVFPALANAQPSNDAASRFERPRVYVGIYLHDISDLSLNTGTYKVDADVWAKWRGDFDPDEIRFANASKISREVLESANDGDWHAARWRIRATMRAKFPVENFPFDTQTLAVRLELPRYIGLLTPDLAGSGVSEEISITDWEISQDFKMVVDTSTYASDLGRIRNEGKPSQVRSISYEVAIARPFMPVALKLFLPLGIIALIIFLSIFAPPRTLQPPLTMCVSGLVAVFAFQFSIGNILPRVSYLTLADKLFIIAYFLAICCTIVVVTSNVLALNDRTKAVRRLRLSARILLPLFVLGSVIAAIPSKPTTDAPPVAEAPTIEREQSTRDRLRIGTTTPLRLSTSAIGAASRWGVTYRDQNHRRAPLVLQELPSPSNDSMRFLRDGSLETTWRIRHDARWSNGDPITVDDMLLPLTTHPDDRIIDYHAADEHTLVLRWKERSIAAMQPPQLWPSTHLKNTLVTEDADALNHALNYEKQPTTGPYRITEISTDRITAERNPEFFLPNAAIEKVELQYFETHDALRAALLSGEIDISTPMDLPESALRAYYRDKDLTIGRSPSMNAVFIALPLTDTPWDDVNARNALLQAIDRPSLTARRWGKDQQIADVPMTQTPSEHISRVAFDPKAAQRFFETIDPSLLETTLYWSAPMSKDTAQTIADNLENIGFSIELKEVDSTWPMWASQDFDGLLLHSIRVEYGSDPAQWWALPSANNTLQRHKETSVWTGRIRRLVDSYEHALFRERREQLGERIEQAWANALPLIPLYFDRQYVIVSKALKGWNAPTQQPFGSTMDSWYFADPKDDDNAP